MVYNSIQSSEAATIIIFTLQMRKRRHREVNSLAQGHTASQGNAVSGRAMISAGTVGLQTQTPNPFTVPPSLLH